MEESAISDKPATGGGMTLQTLQGAAMGKRDFNGISPPATGAGVTSRALLWGKRFVHLVVILACVAPGLWVNVNAVWAQGGRYADVACVSGYSLAASILTFFFVECLWQRRWGWAAGILPLAAFFIILNWGIAMGGFSVVHEAMRETRADQIQKKAENSAAVTELRKVAGFASPEMVEKEIAELKRDRSFQSSGECATDGDKKITVKASESLCKEIAKAERKLGAAKALVPLEAEAKRQGWAAGTSTEKQDATADPMIENLTQLILTLFNLSVSEKLMGAIIAALKALGTELLADAVPPIIVILWRMLNRHDTRHYDRRETSPIIDITPTPEEPVMTPIMEAMTPSAMTPEKALVSNAPEPVMEPIMEDAPAPPQDTHDRRPMTRKTPSKKEAKTPADPARLGDVAQWAEDNVERSESDKLQATPMHKEYIAWCNSRGKHPVTLYAFGLTLAELGWAKQNIGGKIYYTGARMKKQLRVVTQ